MSVSGEQVSFSIMVAMCDNNRGIAFRDELPWPKIPQDFAYYTEKTSKTVDTGKKCVHIQGRVTWECLCDAEKGQDVIKILISNTLKSSPPKNVYAVVGSFEEAIQLCQSPTLLPLVEQVWAMGGVEVYRAAINCQLFKHLYLTRVYGDFTSDTFFPAFEDQFQICRNSEKSPVIKENGVKYRFEIYERK